MFVVRKLTIHMRLLRQAHRRRRLDLHHLCALCHSAKVVALLSQARIMHAQRALERLDMIWSVDRGAFSILHLILVSVMILVRTQPIKG